MKQQEERDFINSLFAHNIYSNVCVKFHAIVVMEVIDQNFSMSATEVFLDIFSEDHTLSSKFSFLLLFSTTTMIESLGMI